MQSWAVQQCQEAMGDCSRAVVQMITMVESTDGQRALLGRPKSLQRSGVLTCLSGFIEQGESIEEAVRREVREEAGIAVGQVTVLGSQPWPIGTNSCTSAAPPYS